MTDNLVSKEYWDSLWEEGKTPEPVDPKHPSLRNHVYRDFDEIFVEVLGETSRDPRNLLEIGCARSRWLPYFAQRFGLGVSGLDYSEDGCARSREILDKAGVDGRVVCADLFAPPPSMLGSFDAVVSFGVVEHFDDTPAALEAMSLFLKPGGLLLTVIPNLTGWIGLATRILNRPVFEQHVPLDLNQLVVAHRSAGLDPMAARWLAASNFGVVNLNGLSPDSLTWRFRWAATRVLLGVSVAAWIVERGFGVRIRRGRRWSPYAVCVARRRPTAPVEPAATYAGETAPVSV